MSDKLSAASLLLTIVAVLYGMWYPQLVDALATEVPRFAQDRRAPRREVAEVFWRRAMPLTGAALGVAAVFAPDAAGIVWYSLKLAVNDVSSDYDSVAAAFLLVELLSVCLALHFVRLVLRFWRRLRDFSVGQGNV